MKSLILIALLATTTTFADPGIMIDIDIFIDKPSGKPETEMA